MHTDSGIRSGNRAVRLGRGVWAAAALVDFIILLRVSALTESSWALGALLFGTCALGVLWNRLFCSRACRGFFAVRSGAKIFSLVLILLFGAGSLAFCAMASPKALRLVLLTLLVAVQLFSLPLTERAESVSRKTRTVLLTVMKRHEAVLLRRYVKRVDPHAFVLIINTGEIVGKGFRGVN